LRTEDLVEREGLSRKEASRRAHREFGHVETHREAARAAWGLQVFDQLRFSWIDLRLGFRMLVKHPWLTAAAAFALAVGIPLGMAPTHLANALEAPLPGDPDDRIRAVRLWDPVTTGLAVPVYADFEFWSAELSSFSALAAFRNSTQQIGRPRERAGLVSAVQISASAFDILSRPPFLGRSLDTADEAPGAPAVALIGQELWTSRFGADPGVVGRTIRVGDVPHTVVGVMPEGFRFPLDEQLWLPLRVDLASMATARVRVFGRLADGVGSEAAQAEVSALGGAEIPAGGEARRRLRPEVVPFGLGFIGLPRRGLDSVEGFLAIQGLAWVLLLVACGNVAMLIFARTATRFRELAIRTALGASRLRIVSQLFLETLVLAVLSAGVGLFAVERILGWMNLAVLAGQSRLPYWLDLGVTGHTVFLALALAVVSATVAGVVPAIRITGRGVRGNLRRAESGGSGFRFGGVTSTLIVADIAVSVAAVGLAVNLVEQTNGRASSDDLAGIPAAEFLALEVRIPSYGPQPGSDPPSRDLVQRLAATQLELVERLSNEPGVRALGVAAVLPRMEHPSRLVELDGTVDSGQGSGRHVRSIQIDVDYLKGLGQPILMGRGFDRSDLGGDTGVILVNTVFVEEFLGGRDPLGERLRLESTGSGGRSYEIVGVIGHLGANMVSRDGGSAVYLPAAPGTIHPLRVAVHATGTPAELASRVRAIAAAVDPGAIVEPPVALDTIYQGDWYIVMWVAMGLVVLVGVLLTLAASGLYAIMSFSVSERTREIGIRGALGATRGSLVTTILRRAVLQIGLGALLGLPLAWRFLYDAGQVTPEPFAIRSLLLALGVALAVVTVVGLFSCLVPARRILGVEASQALRTEG